MADKRTSPARIGPKAIEALLPQIQLYFVEGVGKMEIWRVEGKVIRDKVNIDFTEGGNSQRYPWMGPNKIWIDHDVDDDEITQVKAHELHEFVLMSQGWDYDPAHDNSNATVEQVMRDHPERIEQIWEEQKRLYLEVCERR
jgi:hypothetical protein